MDKPPPPGPHVNGFLRSEASPKARMAAFAVAFVIVAVAGLILGAGAKALALAMIAGGLASLGVEWSTRAGARMRRR